MAPQWMIKQVTKINGKYNVDRNNNFGGRASGGIWGCFFGLVLWIAVFVRQIKDIFGYVDDTFSFDITSNMLWYPPYSKLMPAKQVKLLQLWDEIGIPHAEAKQISGSPLTIIGFEVDPNTMSITMPESSRHDLITTMESFAVLGRCPKLSDYQALAGWISWALNVYPLLRPCLCQLYLKIKGKKLASKEIHVNVRLCQELCWAIEHLKTSRGILLLKSLDWTPNDADYILLTDACPAGIAYWSPHHTLGFQSRVPPSTHLIFYWEAYAIVAAFHWIIHLVQPTPSRVVIYTDNTNAIGLFQSLWASSEEYNPLALTICDLMIRFNCQLRVMHISGKQNIVADALSRFNNNLASSIIPNLFISHFNPPPLIVGADLR